MSGVIIITVLLSRLVCIASCPPGHLPPYCLASILDSYPVGCLLPTSPHTPHSAPLSRLIGEAEELSAADNPSPHRGFVRLAYFFCYLFLIYFLTHRDFPIIGIFATKNAGQPRSSDASFYIACFMLAVSLDTLPSITSRRKFKSPTRTHHISQVWARCPAEHHNVPVINLPSRSTALTCRHTETFLVSSILYSTLRTTYFFFTMQRFLKNEIP